MPGGVRRLLKGAAAEEGFGHKVALVKRNNIRFTVAMGGVLSFTGHKGPVLRVNAHRWPMHIGRFLCVKVGQ